MTHHTEAAPKVWRGRFYEDFDVGDVFKSRLGRTITETDNIWFTLLTLNTNQMHFNTPYTEGTRFGQPLVNSAFTLALVTGMTVPDTSENATANLSWTDIKLPKPLFVGDTVWAEMVLFNMRKTSTFVSESPGMYVTGRNTQPGYPDFPATGTVTLSPFDTDDPLGNWGDYGGGVHYFRSRTVGVGGWWSFTPAYFSSSTPGNWEAFWGESCHLSVT